jgi:hypothetical protein
MTDPYYINELQSDLRGVKEGWYAIDERGRLLSGPFSNQEICLTRISPSQRQTNVESKVHLLTNRESCWAKLHAERSKPSPRISGKRQSTSDGYGDNRGGVCLDGATSFVNCRTKFNVARLGVNYRF